MDEEIPYFPLLYGKSGHDLEEFVDTYASFIRENEASDVILATAWPYMCYIAKKALVMNGNKSTKIISWLHAPVERYKAAGYGGYEHLAFADAHFAISKTIFEGIQSALPGSCVWLVRNPVNFERCRKVSYTMVQHNKMWNLYFIGRVSKEKRLDVIINAIAVNEGRWHLHIIGSGDDAYETQIRMLGQERGIAKFIHWLGWKENPWEYVQDADAVVLASEYEGFPLVAIEALINGIPVVSTPVSGIVELIKPGVNGYLYLMGDWKMSAKIMYMISEGVLPVLDKEVCRSTVQKFDAVVALEDFGNKLEEIILNRKNEGKDS